MKNFIRTVSAFIIAAAAISTASAQTAFKSVSDPEGITTVYVGATKGIAWYSIDHGRSLSMPASRLGLKTNAFDWSELEMVSFENDEIVVDYTMDRTKTSQVNHKASTATATFTNPNGEKIHVEFIISRNDVAFRYLLPKEGETGSVRVLEELTEFNFSETSANDQVRTYLTPQSDAMKGWKRTTPSYEEHYGIARPMAEKSRNGHGFTFPCLFNVQEDGWVLISETGVDGRYCGSRLGDSRISADGSYYSYKIEYPMPEENNGNGTIEPGIALPGTTPWRTITLGESLKPIVETTIAWDVVDPRYETEHEYKYGKGTWSWIVWQDASINFEDQLKYVDLAAAMNFQYVLVDNWWDTNIGKEKIAELVEYAAGKGIDVFLWYSSSGWWNDIEQGPVNIMSDPITRKKEMRWMHNLGVKGIKVDFFGGDKQETMRHYEAILSDADDNGLMVIFHGCTLPRGWEKMYPNYVGSEAVRASENLVFSQFECNQEAQAACLHPFIRNTVGSMEFGGCFMNERLSKDNTRGTARRTTDVFQIATCVLFQNPIQNFALAPNNLEDAPEACLDFLREVPTTWDETRYIDGRPGEHVALARRNGNTWYVAAINACDPVQKYNVWEMVEEIKDGGSSDWKTAKESIVRIYEGGNSPVVRNVPAGDLYKTDISVEKNDGVVIVFDVE
ncbi:MAG: glycoside hydrolase family 97 protein [Bacteroidales bacterium]|nr:glycoside hydrolase family 97 protein [Bacteroidales bacterium]